MSSDAPLEPTTGWRALPEWLAVVLVAGTSAAVLVLEILAGRLLAPYVGVSLETYTGIIGTILAGIAVGAWAGGALADRLDPRRLIPVLLVLGGALSIATIPIVRVVGAGAGPGGGPMILLLAAVGFLPSATVLSAVPPAVVKLQLRELADTGVTVGRLSAWGTAGAIVGTFLTGFVLVAAANVTTLIVGVGVLLMVAGIAMWLQGRARAVETHAEELLGVVGLAALSLVGVVAVPSPCETQTTYYCLSVDIDPDREGGRVLVLDDLRHSYVDLDDPTHLEFWYVRRIADVMALHGPIDDVLYLGGGGLTVPRYVRATMPGVDQIVLEIDGDLLDVVESELGYEPSDDIDVRIADARLAVAELADDSADVVVGDAFGSRSVPFHLATREFVAELRRVLVDDGVYVANVIDAAGQRFLAAEAATLRGVFDHVTVVRGPSAVAGGRGNSVVVASDRPIDEEAISRAIAASDDGGAVVDDLDTFTDGAPVLTDDFAPVDQLIAAGD